MSEPTFYCSGIGGELPPRDTFVEEALEESREGDRPQESQTVVGSPNCGRNNSAGSDTGRGNKQAGPDQLGEVEPADLLFRFQKRLYQLRIRTSTPLRPLARPRTAAGRSRDRRR